MYVFLKAFKGNVLVFANGRFKRDIKRQPRNLNVELLILLLIGGVIVRIEWDNERDLALACVLRRCLCCPLFLPLLHMLIKYVKWLSQCGQYVYVTWTFSPKD